MSCKQEALSNIAINSLSVKQAFKLFLIHEKNRHFDDISKISTDLEKLIDVRIPDEAMALVNHHFDISEGVTETEREGLKE